MLKIEPLMRMWRRARATADEFHAHGQAAFDALSPRLFRDVFLVGFPEDPRVSAQLAGTHAPDVSIFADASREMHRRMKEVEDADAENRGLLPLGYSLPRKLSIIPDLIEEVLDPVDPGTVSFPSVSVGVGDYRVSVVLRLNRAKLAEQPSIARADDDSSDPDSLAAALVEEFHRRCRDVLHAVPHLAPLRALPGELLRAAGEELMKGVVNREDMDPGGIHSLFQDCDIISSMHYEGTETSGGMVIVPENGTRGGSPFGVQVGLAKAVPLEEHRTVRKLVQITDADRFLVSDGSVVSGIGSLRAWAEARDLDFSVRFVGHHAWELLYRGKVLMRVKSGVPGLPGRPIGRDAFARALAVALPGTQPAVDRLWPLVDAAMRQRHGTTLVISADAAGEAARLGAQGIPLTPVPATADLLERLTTIDGAVLLGPDGMCHAIGIILDGRATEHGNRARGSRFNSAVRYAGEHPGECLVVVVSEDGMADLVPPSGP